MSDLPNPPAFPQQCADALDVGMVHEGMSLRDWFAGQALAGLASRDTVNRSDRPSAYAASAFAVADAMLAERAKGGDA